MMITMIKKYTIEEFKSYGTAGRIAQEIIGSIRTVISLGLHRKVIDDYSKSLHVSEKMAIKKGITSGFFASLANAINLFCFGLGIFYATYLVRNECREFGVNQVIPCFFCIITASFSFGQAFGFFRDLAEAKGAARKVYKVLESKSEIDVLDTKATNKQTLSEMRGNIVLENIHFSYPSRPNANILNGLTLNITAGKTVALVGSRLIKI